MRVEIEISDEEAGVLRTPQWAWVNDPPNLSFAETLLHRVAQALPRPIQVGDTVERIDGTDYEQFIVKAIDGDVAWVVGGASGRHFTFRLAALAAAVESDRNPQ